MRSMLADRGNLLVTRFDSSCSHSATIETFIFDTALGLTTSLYCLASKLGLFDYLGKCHSKKIHTGIFQPTIPANPL